MNIFYLDQSPAIAAKYHCDKHVVKMLLETGQLLSGVYRYLEPDPPKQLYKLTHVNHPCSEWARYSEHTYSWLTCLFSALHDEYKRRFDREHLTWSKLRSVVLRPPTSISDRGWIHPPQCMPEKYRCTDTVQAYRNYYKGEKAYMATWKLQTPNWWEDR